MWKNACNGGRLCYRKVKITSNSATEATTHTDESNDYVAWYDKATGTLYLKCYQGGKIVTAGYDNTTLTIVLEGENNTITYTKTGT